MAAETSARPWSLEARSLAQSAEDCAWAKAVVGRLVAGCRWDWDALGLELGHRVIFALARPVALRQYYFMSACGRTFYYNKNNAENLEINIINIWFNTASHATDGVVVILHCCIGDGEAMRCHVIRRRLTDWLVSAVTVKRLGQNRNALSH
jgi:hypothetical protein